MRWSDCLQVLALASILGAPIALVAPPTEAQFGFEPNLKHGAVYARAIVRDENGDPIYVEYGADGRVVSEIGPATGDLADKVVMSGSEFRSYITVVAAFEEQHQSGIAEGAELITAEDYRSGDFRTVEDQPMVKPPLANSTRSVLIRAQDQRFLADADQLILLEVPVDLVATPNLEDTVQSLLISEDGSVHTTSQHNIGYKVGYFGDDVNRAIGRDYDDEIHGPVQGVPIDIWTAIGGKAVTNERGLYAMTYFMPPCPGFTYDYNTPLWAELRYRNFNPIGERVLPYYLQRPDFTFCNGLGAFPPSFTLSGLMAQVAVIGTIAAQPTFNIKADFPVDVMMLTGRIAVTNQGTATGGTVQLGGETSYSTEVAEDRTPRVHENFDFDGDEEPDLAVVGELIPMEDPDTGEDVLVFQPNPLGALQGIYLSSGDRTPDAADEELRQPNFTRLADFEPSMEPQGLLGSLSYEDLQNTDIYVFRRSNGRLVMERQGLQASEVGNLASSTVNQETGRLVYRLLIRGPRDAFSLVGRRYEDFAEWQSKAKIAPELHSRSADQLRAGEEIQIIAINRATGYIGSTTTPLMSADQGVGEISFPIEDIQMGPPNLKLSAKRATQIELGLTADEEVEHIIGYEGSGLISDTFVEIRTEWFAADGTALPEGLGDYGYTGRLARVSGAGSLSPVGGNLAQFPIKPGVHLQLVQLRDEILNKQHFYVHVSGDPHSRNPNFGSTGANAGVLSSRPDKFVPVKVQIYDEKASIDQGNLYRRLRRENPDESLTKPQPVYREVHRPEFQFSVFDLEVAEINREDSDGERIDILPNERPTITSSDELVELLYSLVGSELQALPQFDEPRQLVFALGEQELNATILEDQTLVFDDLDHLFDIEVADFLALRLYASNDAANVLWQYAFAALTIEFAQDYDFLHGENLYVRADDPTVELAAIIAGYAALEEEDRWDERVIWQVVEGSATISEPAVEVDESGIARTTVELSPYVDNNVVVRARLQTSPDSYAETIDIGIIAGRPASMSVSQSGQTYTNRHGEVSLTTVIRDQHGNLVPDGTQVFVKSRGSAYVKSYVSGTVDGVATAVLKGGATSGPSSFYVESQGIRQDGVIDVQPLQLEHVGFPPETAGGEKVDLTVRATAAGAPVPGVFVNVGVSNGILERKVFTTNVQGEIEFSLHTPTRDTRITVTSIADTNSPLRTDIDVVNDEEANHSLSQEFVVLGLDGALQGSLTSFSGDSVTVDYVAESAMSMSGPAGGGWTTDFDPYHLINRNPVYLNNFYSLVGDARGEYPATFENVIRSSDAPVPGLFAAQFIDVPMDEMDPLPSQISIAHALELEIGTPAFNFWLRPTTGGRILEVGDGVLTLDLDADNHLTGTARLVGSPPASVRSAGPVTLGSWQQIALGYRNGSLYIVVDDAPASTATAGEPIEYGSAPAPDSDEAREWLRIGNGFVGEMSLLRISDWASPPVLQLSATSGTYDPSGTASVTVGPTAAFEAAGAGNVSLSVGLVDGSGNRVSITTVDRPALDRYALSYAEIEGDAAVTMSDIGDAISFAELFPTLDQPIASLFYRQIGDTDGPLSVVLASLAWMGLRAETELLVPSIETFQLYYSDHEDKALLALAAEYLAEAVSEADNGENFKLMVARTGLLVWSEMIAANPNAADYVASAIGNRADFWTWLRFMAMPGNGWESSVMPIARPESRCEDIVPTVNIGTPFEYSADPCRLTGDVIADFVGWGISDPDLADDPTLFSDYIRNLMNALEGAPYEVIRSLLVGSATTDSLQLAGIDGLENANAALPALALRALLLTLKGSLKSLGSNAVVNMRNFFTNGTTSRFKPLEFIGAIAYLQTQKTSNGCTSKCLNADVAANVDSNLAKWFLGIGLSRRGEIPSENVKKKSCAISAGAHGAALELVATAVYHSMYDVLNQSQFEILLADPRTGPTRANVPVGQQLSFGRGIGDYGKAPHLRHPDLVMKGTSSDRPYWVELKSWKYDDSFVTGGKLSRRTFKLWNGEGKTKGLSHMTAAHRQHFLDYAATRATLFDEWSDANGALSLKPGSHRAWVQVWKDEQRFFRPKKTRTNRFPAKKRIDMDKAWIDTNGIVLASGLNSRFRLLQEFLTQAPTMSRNAFRTTIGYEKGEHRTRYMNDTIGKRDGKVVPFTVKNVYAVELGESAGPAAAKTALAAIGAAIGAHALGEYLAIEDFSEEELENLQELLQEEIDKNLGVVNDILETLDEVTPEFWKKFEGYVTDQVAGAIGDTVQDAINAIEVPPTAAPLFGNLCEIP